MTFSQRSHLWLTSIQQGFVAILPVIFIGVIALTCVQIPVYFPSLAGLAIFEVGQILVQATYGLLALILTISISYQLAQSYRIQFDLALNELIVAMLAGVTLIAISYMNGVEQGALDFGFAQMIHGLLVSIVFTEFFVIWQRFTPFKFSYLDHEIHGILSVTLRMIVPGVVLSAAAVSAYYFLIQGVTILPELVMLFIGDVDSDQGLTTWQSVRMVLLNQLFWFVGIHGSSVIAISGELLYTNLNAQNFNPEIMSHYAFMGGSGCTLGLVMAMLFSRRKSNRHFSRYALIPSLFNINELVIFGLPIVLNRFLFLPFIFMPILAMLLVYLGQYLGFVDFSRHGIVWSMPFLLGGYLLSDHWSGAALQLVVCIVSGLVYWPFLKRYEQFQEDQQAVKLKGFIQQMSEPDFDFRNALRQPSDIGVFSRRILNDIESLDGFEMHYQPKVNDTGAVYGAEALIRWQHPVYGPLPPSVFIPIAESSQHIHLLGLWIIERCFKDMKIMSRSHGFESIPIAINVSPVQLAHPDFVFEVKKRISSFAIDPKLIELEITEGQKLLLDDGLIEGLRQLVSIGVSIGVDDFGMGHTSVHYLKSFPVHTLKIDGEVIKDVATSPLVQEIVQSMTQLAHGMNAIVVAEWVEEDAQLDVLKRLGCDQYQGKLFSMPLPLPELVAYCVKHQKA